MPYQRLLMELDLLGLCGVRMRGRGGRRLLLCMLCIVLQLKLMPSAFIYISVHVRIDTVKAKR
jgi:hypothetical protein